MISERPIQPPGIYYNIPAEEYFSWDAVNASALKKMADCAANYDWCRRNPPEPTPAMILGTVCHAAILEPETLKERFLVAGDCCSIKKDGGGCTNQGRTLSGGHWYCGVHNKKVKADEIPASVDEDGGVLIPMVVTQDQMVKAQQITISVRANRAARDLLVPGKKEVCAVWVDSETGLLCKMRMDNYEEEEMRISDVKTCESAAPEKFSKDVADRGYDIQAAFYLDGISIASGGILHDAFYFIAAAKSEAMVTAVYKCHQGMVSLGRYRYRKALADYKWCKENNSWPGYHDHQIEPLNVPHYFFERESKK